MASPMVSLSTLIAREAPRPVDADADGVAAQMTPPGAAVAAVAAGHMALARDPVADLQAADFHADFGDFADERMADDHRNRDGGLRPFVPVVDMDVGAADRRLLDLDQHVIVADGGQRGVLHPDAGLGLGLDQGLHMTPRPRPTLAKSASARSSWPRSWAAETWVRMRALPWGTTG